MQSDCAVLPPRPGHEISVMVIEKGGEIGNHGISGAVLDPRSFDELFVDWRTQAPVEAAVSSDELWFLTRIRQDQSADRSSDARQSRQVRRVAAKVDEVDGRAGRSRGRRRVSVVSGTRAAVGRLARHRRAYRRQGRRQERSTKIELRARPRSALQRSRSLAKARAVRLQSRRFRN